MDVLPLNSWPRELVQSYCSLEDLLEAGLISESASQRLAQVAGTYEIRVPRYYAGLMTHGADCPIRKQALPALDELDPELPEWAREWSQMAFGRETPWTGDPIGDVKKLVAPRLTHRYANRAILHTSSACALLCRFCFRKSHLNEKTEELYDGSFDAALAYLAEHREITEIILTGGDPLSLSDTALTRLLEKLSAISHLRVIRIHSRMAVTMPSRITLHLASSIEKAIASRESLSIRFVSHFNHVREWTDEARRALRALKKAGADLCNQSVLLRGVNDSADALTELFQALYEFGVQPMYLHHADWTPGTFHFRVSISKGQRIMRALAGNLPGAAIPRYVLDLPGGHGKTELLGESAKRIETRTDTRAGDRGIAGALYEMRAPETRSNTAGKMLVPYAEFYFPEETE